METFKRGCVNQREPLFSGIFVNYLKAVFFVSKNRSYQQFSNSSWSIANLRLPALDGMQSHREQV
jgi:hypothetical protein